MTNPDALGKANGWKLLLDVWDCKDDDFVRPSLIYQMWTDHLFWYVIHSKHDGSGEYWFEEFMSFKEAIAYAQGVMRRYADAVTY